MATWWFFRFLDWARGTRWLMTLVVLSCLGVGAWGFYAYYGPEFRWIGLEHWYVFPFVPDCPLFVYLFAVVYVLRSVGIQWPAFTAFVALGNIKYGVWTVFVLFYYFERFFQGEGVVLRTTILLLHVGMVPLGLLLWRTLPKLPGSQYLGVVGALLVFDYFDYFFTEEYQVYPIGLPYQGSIDGVPQPLPATQLGLVPWFTIAESLLLGLAMWRIKPVIPPAEPVPTAS